MPTKRQMQKQIDELREVVKEMGSLLVEVANWQDILTMAMCKNIDIIEGQSNEE